MPGILVKALVAVSAAVTMTGVLAAPAAAQPPGTTPLAPVALSWGVRGDGALGNGDTATRNRPVFVCAVGTTNCAPEPLTGVKTLAAGASHTLALKPDNTVVAWGNNINGELGIGINADRTTPTPVCAVGATDCAADPLRNVAAVAVGGSHSLALLTDGTLVSWGNNEYGQLGHFATGYSVLPRPVCAIGATDCAANPLRNVSAIAAGNRHTVAMLADGTVLSWGNNTFGQLGNGTKSNRQETPAPVCAPGAADCTANPLKDVTAFAVGGAHNLARRADGTIVSWGNNLTGQLGDNSKTDRTTPVYVCAVGATDCAANPLTGVTALSAAGIVQSQDGIWSHNLALRTDGTVVAWGHDGYGQLGDNSMTDRTTPVQVCAVGATDCAANPLAGVTSIAAGGLHSQALLPDGRVLSWGNNERGQLGDHSSTNRGTPVFVCAPTAADCAAKPLANVAAIASGGSHGVVVLSDRRVMAWGSQNVHQLGDGVPGQARPAAVCAPGFSDCAATMLSAVKAVSAGGGYDGFGASGYSLALRSDGTVLGWGFNGHGQVGDGTWTHSSTPQRVCAVGASDCRANPLTGVVAVAAGGNHSLALLSNGQVVAWGDNWRGQLGDRTSNGRNKPGRVCAVGATDCTANPLTGVVAIAAGNNHSMAVLSDGRVVAWGENNSGQLGDGTSTNRNSPVFVCAVGATNCATNPLTGVSKVDGGVERTLALLSTGTVLTWGWSKSTPAYVCAVGATDCAARPLTGATAISAGDNHNLALMSDHTVVGWGTNYSGELGDSTNEFRTAPIRVCAVGATNCTANPLSNVSAISAGETQSLAIVNGTVVGWGGNLGGQVGDGSGVTRFTPVQVCAVGASDCTAGPLTKIQAVSAGYGHVLALRSPR